MVKTVLIAARICLLTGWILSFLTAFPQEVKKAQPGTYRIMPSTSKQEVALAEEVLYVIEENRKDSENTILNLPSGIGILIFSRDSVKAMKLPSGGTEIVPEK